MATTKNKKNINIPIGDGLRNSLESLQASLDEWVSVEKNINNPKTSPKTQQQGEFLTSDKDLIDKLVAQIEKLSN